jgi:hypothetical protein
MTTLKCCVDIDREIEYWGYNKIIIIESNNWNNVILPNRSYQSHLFIKYFVP